ncbi:hypothetical protein, partial [Streptococcus pneumoniae]|uniref:hypothetical protein n=1 Tax=Streptococcus pneumoniae TaxID=1313 RepID=UPI001E3F5C76
EGNSLRGHNLAVDYYHPISADKKLQLVVGSKLFTGKFDPSPSVSNDVNKLGFSIGVSRKY